MSELVNSVNAFGDLGLAALFVWRLLMIETRLTIIETKLG